MTTYSVAQAAEKIGLTVFAIRFYCEQGLIPGVMGDDQRNWQLGPETLRWLENVKYLRLCGMSLQTIQTYVGATRQVTPIQDRSFQDLDESQQRLPEIQACQTLLAHR